MDDEENMADAAWDQQAQDERRRREDSELERLRPIAKQFRHELNEFEATIFRQEKNRAQG